MRKRYKILYFLALIIILFFCHVNITMAADADANAGNNSYINNNGVRIFPLGCRSRWSGFILYIIDGSANLQSEVKVVLSQTTEPKYNPGESIIYTRLGESSVDLATAEMKTGGIGGYPPFDNDGNACGGDIRDWMLSQDNGAEYNLYNVLEDYFLSDIPDVISKFVDNDWYLIIEPFFWYGYYVKDDTNGEVVFTGDWVCGTAPMIAEQENAFNMLYNLDSVYGSTYFKRYTNRNFPNCCRFLRGQFGVDILLQGGNIKNMPTNEEIIDYGYGIISFWAGEVTIEDIIPVTDTIEDWEKTVNIGIEPKYYTGNCVAGYDVSNSIPTDSTIINNSVAASYYFDKLHIGVRRYTRNYSKPITLYEETILADGSTSRQAVYNGYINAKATVTFEYIKKVPDIYEFVSMKVKNNVYDCNEIEYTENIAFINNLNIYGEIYSGDTNEKPVRLTQDSRLIPGNAHFVLPDHEEEVLSAPYEAVINTVTLKKEDKVCSNTDCDDGWIEDWSYCNECGGDGIVSGMADEECDYCNEGDIITSVQCGDCFGTGLGDTVRCSSCGAQVFEKYQICGRCGAEGEPGDYECFNCNGNGYTSRSWVDAWMEYSPDLPCGVCDATGYDEGELCYLCNGSGNAGTPYYHEGEWAYNTCGTCGGTKTVFICPETGCNGDGDNFTEKERCTNCGNDETTNNCENCEGKGFVLDTISCSTCGGDGIITISVTEECGECDEGYIYYSDRCRTCGGDGIIQAGSSVITEENRYFTADEIMAAVKEQAEIVAGFIGLNANARNDALMLCDNDNGCYVYFMADEQVEGADITISLDGSIFTGKTNAGEYGSEYTEGVGSASGVVTLEGGNASESPYGAESCVERVSLPTSITMGTSVGVDSMFGNGRAATGIEIHYEHAFLGYDVEMHAGKAVHGNISEVDSIYNHVLEGYVGVYHNGGDPDDGYPIVVSEEAVEVSTTTPVPITTPAPTTTETEGTTTPEMTTIPKETTTSAPEAVVTVGCLDIVDCNFTRQTRPSSQLVDVMENAEYYLTLDSSYYLLLAEAVEDNKHVVKKEMQFPFEVYYDGTYYKTDASGYTEWIEVNAPDNYKDVWDEDVSMADYESNNHWYVTPIYIPSWAKETNSTDNLTYVSVRVTNKLGEELINSVSIQLSGVIYGFTITGISDISQYYNMAEVNAGGSINFNAAEKKLEWRVGTRNRIGGSNLRYLSDGALLDVAEDYQTLPIRKGSGDGSGLSKTGDGEMSVGTSFSFIVKSIAGLTGEDDYIEIIPHFKYFMPDGTKIDEESLLILYEHETDNKWYIAGSNTEKGAFMALVDSDEKDKEEVNRGISACLGLERFDEAYYDADDTTLKRYGDWVKYTFEQYNKRLSVNERIDMHRFINRQYVTNLLGRARIPSGLRLYSGEYEQLVVNLDKEPDEVITCNDYNEDGITDVGYDAERLRQSMQTWYGNYMVNQNIYIVNKSLYPEFWVDGNPVRLEADERIMRDGKLIIGFEINAYKNGVKHLTYGEMWKTEGQKRYTVKEYITDTDSVNIKDPDFQYDKILHDGLMIDYGDVAVVDVNDKLSDDYWNSGSFIIN